MSLLVFALVIALPRAYAGSPATPEEATPAPTPTPAERLEESRHLYAQGRTAEARAALQSLLTLGPELPAPVRRETLAYLGDVLYAEEGPDAAAPFFRALLDEAPDYALDPLQHPEEVTRFFASLRPKKVPLDVEVTRPPPPPPPPSRGPPPLLALAPGGVYYFAHNQIGAGVTVASVQTALLVTNLVLYNQIAGIDDVERGSADVEAWRQARLLTDLSAGAFYLSLVLPPAVEFGRWGSTPATKLALGPGAVSVSGTF